MRLAGSSPGEPWLAPTMVVVLACAAALPACRVSDPAPSHARGVVTADTLARYPTAVVDSAGAALVAWTSSAGGSTNVYLARVSDGLADEPVRVNDIEGDAASHAQAPAQVAAGPDGTVYVAWIAQRDIPGRRFPASDLRLARSDDGGRTFAPAVTVNDDGGFTSGHHFHDVAVAPDGSVYVSWLDSRVKDAHRRETGEAGAAARDGHEGHDHEAHGAADEPGTEVRLARSTDGGRSFGESTVVASGACECCRTRVAFGSDGEVYVAWRHQFGADIRDPAVSRSDDGGVTFGEPVRVAADEWRISGCPHSGPAITVDLAGRVHVAWHTGAPGRAGLYHAMSDDRGASFHTPSQIAAAGAARPELAPRASGAWMAWEEPASDVVRVARLSPAGAIAVRRRRSGSSPALAAGVIVRLDGGRIVASGLP